MKTLEKPLEMRLAQKRSSEIQKMFGSARKSRQESSFATKSRVSSSKAYTKSKISSKVFRFGYASPNFDNGVSIGNDRHSFGIENTTKHAFYINKEHEENVLEEKILEQDLIGLLTWFELPNANEKQQEIRRDSDHRYVQIVKCYTEVIKNGSSIGIFEVPVELVNNNPKSLYTAFTIPPDSSIKLNVGQKPFKFNPATSSISFRHLEIVPYIKLAQQSNQQKKKQTNIFGA